MAPTSCDEQKKRSVRRQPVRETHLGDDEEQPTKGVDDADDEESGRDIRVEERASHAEKQPNSIWSASKTLVHMEKVRNEPGGDEEREAEAAGYVDEVGRVGRVCSRAFLEKGGVSAATS